MRLLIIADDGVGAVFVLFIELVPRAETGLGRVFVFRRPCVCCTRVMLCCKQGKVGFGADGFASNKRGRRSMGRNAFKCPKLLGVVFLVAV